MAATRPMTKLAGSTRARWLYVAHRVLQKLSGGRAGLYVYLFCAQPTKGSESVPMRDDANTRIVSVSAGDALIKLFPRPEQVIAARFAAASRCYAVLVKEQFAGHIWLSSGHYQEDEVRCRYLLPDSSVVWDYDVFVVPAFRATRAMARLWKGVSSSVSLQGVSWSYSRISLFNAPSIRSHEQLGARQLCAAGFVVIGKFQLTLFTQPLRLHVAFGNETPEPVLSLPMIKADL